MATHSSILPGKLHGQRSLADYSPWGRKESYATEHTHVFMLLGLIPAYTEKLLADLPNFF